MDKLYSVKEIAEILNNELEAGGSHYRYTEERVRSRLRYLRSKTTDEAKALAVKPRVLGYDKRAKYYTKEDVDKLRSFWVGPMLAEFTDYPEDLQVLESSGNEEVEVREATTEDAAVFVSMLGNANQSSEELEEHFHKMLKAFRKGVFVAQAANGEILGWAQGEISSALSLVRGQSTGLIRLWVTETRQDNVIAARSLILRLQWLLSSQKAKEYVIEAPASLYNVLTTLNRVKLEPEVNLIVLRVN